MGITDDPSVDDIRGLFRLVNACCERWDDPGGWQETLLGGVETLLECRVSQVQVVRPGPEPDLPDMTPLAWRGWTTEHHERLYLDSLRIEGRPTLPNVDKVVAPALGEGAATAFTRPMVVPDEVWYSSEFYLEYVQPTGVDEWAQSFRFAPQFGSVVMIGGSRPIGADPIPPRSVKLLGILAEEIVPLLGTRLSLKGQVSKAGLTARQRQTLELLLDGLSEKQVARELGLSPKTVHDYVVKLHKHFDVSSRGELLSYFIKRRPKDAPGG